MAEVVKVNFNDKVRECEFCGKLLNFPEGTFLISLQAWICDACAEKELKK